MKYSDERLYHTKNNRLYTNNVLESYNNLYNELKTRRDKYHPYDYIVKVLGLYCIYDCMKEQYQSKPDFSELLEGITNQDIQKCLDNFSLEMWKEKVKSCGESFNANPSRKTSEFLNIIQSVIRYGALFKYAKEQGIISSVHKYGKSLVVCENILACRGGDIEQRKVLKGIYKYLTIHIQSMCMLIDENKVDDKVFGFLSDILAILYNEQYNNERYRVDGMRRELYRLFSNTIKVVSSQEEYIDEDVVALNNIGMNGQGYRDFVEQVNPQYTIILFADRLFNDVEENAYVLLNPTKTNIQILTELEYQLYAEIYSYEAVLLTKVKTAKPDKITNMAQLKDITDKWLRDILSSLRILYSVGSVETAVKANGTNI